MEEVTAISGHRNHAKRSVSAEPCKGGCGEVSEKEESCSKKDKACGKAKKVIRHKNKT